MSSGPGPWPEPWIDRYCHSLKANNGVGPCRRRRILVEARQHLLRTERTLLKAGWSREAARAEAERRFGTPESLISSWDRALPRRGSAGRMAGWILASILGTLSGVLLVTWLGSWLAAILGMLLILPTAGIAVGTCLGAAQWLLLRGRVERGCEWIALTAAGVGIGLTLSTMAVELGRFTKGVLVAEAVALFLVGGLTGAVVGCFQSRRLPARIRSGWDWVTRCSVGGATGFVSGGLAAELTIGSFRTTAGLVLLVLLASAVFSALTAGRASAPCPGP